MFILKGTVNQYTITMLLYGRKGRGYTRCRKSRDLDCMLDARVHKTGLSLEQGFSQRI